jgi:hypothetical protein
MASLTALSFPSSFLHCTVKAIALLVQLQLKSDKPSAWLHLPHFPFGRIYGSTHLAYLLYLAKGFLDVAGETPEIAVWLLHQ